MGKASKRKQGRPPAAQPPNPFAQPRGATAPSPASRGPRAAPRSATLALIAPAIVVAAAFAAYANSFSVPLLLDDYIDIIKSPSIKSIESPLAYLTRSRGVILFTYALNYSLGGRDVWGYHLLNVLVHAVNGVLVYALVLTTLRLPWAQGRYAARAPALALFTALAFTLHPLQTMAVSYISQRAESIASLFYLLTVVAFARACTAVDGARRALYAAAALGAAFLGVVSKQIVATVPLTALLYYFCFLHDGRMPSRRAWIAAAALAAPVAYAVFLSWNYLSRPAAPAADGLPATWLFSASAGFALEGVTSWQYLLTQFGVIVHYLRLIVLPVGQCFDYGWPLVDSPWRADVLLPLLLLLVVAAAAVLAFRRYRLATFCVAWFFVVIAPSSSILPLRDAAFEHRVYLPIVGLLWLAVVGAHDAAPWLAARLRTGTGGVLRNLAVLGVVWLTMLGVATVGRNRLFQDPNALAADSAAKAPWHWRPFFTLGSQLAEQGRDAEAIPYLEKAIELGPEHGQAFVALGGIRERQGQYEEARRLYEQATRTSERSVIAAAHANLGNLYMARGMDAEAIKSYEEASRLMPYWVPVHLTVGRLYAKNLRPGMAARHFFMASSIKPELEPQLRREAAEAFVRAALWLGQGGKHQFAANFFRDALERRPDMHDVRHLYAIALARSGQWEAAAAEIERVAAALPDDATVRENVRRIAAGEEPLPPPAP